MELSFPWLNSHALGLSVKQLSCQNRNYLTDHQKFLDSVKLNHFYCLRFDSYDNVDFGEPSYIYATKFCPNEGSQDYLALANEDGRVIIQNTKLSGHQSYVTSFDAHKNAIFGLAWQPYTNGSLITVSGDQTARLWDFSRVQETAVVAEVRVFRGSSRSIKCIEFVPDDVNVFATGSRDNSIYIWDIRCPSDTKAVNVIRNAHLVQSGQSSTPKPAKRRRDSLAQPCSSSGPSSSVTAIQFQDPFTLVSASDSDGIIKFWDLRKSYDRFNTQPMAKAQIPYPGKSALKGYSALIFDKSQVNLFASCTDHNIYKFECAEYSEKPVAVYSGFSNNSKYFSKMSLSSDGCYLASGSTDKCAHIWNVTPQGPKTPIARLEGHEADVTCVEWCPGDFRLLTASDDMRHLIWRPQDRRLEDVDKNLVAGEARLEPDANYFRLPNYETTVPWRPSRPLPQQSPNVKMSSSVKRKIFDENDQNSENKIGGGCNNKTATTENQSLFKSFPCSPRKMFVSPQKAFSSPKKLSIVAASPRKLAIYASPTAHLPNLVLDEQRQLKSPSLSSASGSVKKRRPLNWLTSLSLQKRQQQESPSSASVSSSKSTSEKVSKVTRRALRVKRKLDAE